MINAPSAVKSLLASRPAAQFIANLFTFALKNGETYYFTDAARSITTGGHTFIGGRTTSGGAKVLRGQVKLSRGVSVDSQKVKLLEQDGPLLERIDQGYFNLATYTMQRVFAASPTAPWTDPTTRFFGQVASVDYCGLGSAQLSVKSMLNVLDNDFPRDLIQTDCNNTLYDDTCGLNRAAHSANGTVQSGSTQNTLKGTVTGAADYFALGIITFTSGALAGLSYYVQHSLTDGTIYPGYPFLVAPSPGDAYTISAGCDKTLGTCQSKFGYNASSGSAPRFRGTPFVPPPTVAY